MTMVCSYFISQQKYSALTVLFETVRKHLSKQSIDGTVPEIDCLVLLEYGYCYNK